MYCLYMLVKYCANILQILLNILHILCQCLTYVLQISHKIMCVYCINVVKITFKYEANVIQILCEYCTNILLIFYKYYTNFVNILCHFCTYFVQTFSKYCTYNV